jgi:hypothetical protein
MSNTVLTVELLTTALSGINEISQLDGVAENERRSYLEAVAKASLRAIGATLKFVTATEGEATLPGFGTFSAVDGQITFEPTPDLRQYVFLTQPNAERRDALVAHRMVRLLQGAAALAEHVQGDHTLPEDVVEGSLTPEEQLLRSIFGVQQVHVHGLAARALEQIATSLNIRWALPRTDGAKEDSDIAVGTVRPVPGVDVSSDRPLIKEARRRREARRRAGVLEEEVELANEESGESEP